jgi:ABC-type multidrug transport system ATPase subunit
VSEPVAHDFDALIVEDVSRHFGRRKALSKITFTAHAGSILGLLGPNGAGKSTLLAILATLLQPTSGTIRYGVRAAPDVAASENSESALVGPNVSSGADAAVLRGRIGMLGHDLYLYPELTARENLAFFSALYGERSPGEAADRALARAGLAERAHDPVSSFSRGMRQRVALERALIHRPRLLLLDEPFTGLDEASVAALIGRLRELRGERVIIVLATHDLDVAEGLFDEVVFIRDGRMVETRTGSDMLRAMYRRVMTGIPE